MKLSDIGYVSPSLINLFVRDKAKFIMKIANLDDFDGNTATLRGQAVESALLTAPFYKHKTDKELIDDALAYFSSELLGLSQKQDEKKVDQERKAIPDYIRIGLQTYRSIDDTPIDTQGKITLELKEVSVTIIGYYEIAFENHIRDLKTTKAIKSTLPHSTQRQLAIYSFATKKDAWVDYVSRKNIVSTKIGNVKKTVEQVIYLCQAIEKFLSLSSDIKELAHIFFPNQDSWEWTEDDINNYKKTGVRNDIL